MTALCLLGPWTPMLFQGQEYGATTPFLYFSDASGDLREAIQKGRFHFLTQFPSAAGAEVQQQLAPPSELETFTRCKLDFSQREKCIYDLHCDLLRLRREDPRFREQQMRGVDGAVLADAAFVLRYFDDDGDDRLLVVNFGRRLDLSPAPEPLLAPPFGFQWENIWTSESLRYGGPGTTDVVTDRFWILPAESAVVLRPVPETAPRRNPKKR